MGNIDSSVVKQAQVLYASESVKCVVSRGLHACVYAIVLADATGAAHKQNMQGAKDG